MTEPKDTLKKITTDVAKLARQYAEEGNTMGHAAVHPGIVARDLAVIARRLKAVNK